MLIRSTGPTHHRVVMTGDCRQQRPRADVTAAVPLTAWERRVESLGSMQWQTATHSRRSRPPSFRSSSRSAYARPWMSATCCSTPATPRIRSSRSCPASVAIINDTDGIDVVVTEHGPGRFLGELNLLTGQRVYLTARVSSAGRGDRGSGARAAAVDRHRSGPERHDPDCVRRPPCDPDGGIGERDPGDRLAVLAGDAGDARVPGPQPAPAPVARRRHATPTSAASRPSSASASRLPGGVDRRRRCSAGQRRARSASTSASPSRRSRSAASTSSSSAPARPAWRPRSTAPPRGCDADGRVGRPGRAGRHQLADRELPRLPDRHLRQRPHRPGDDAGAKFGAHADDPVRGDVARASRPGTSSSTSSDGTEFGGRAVIVATGARYRRLDVDRLADFEGTGVYYAATDDRSQAVRRFAGGRRRRRQLGRPGGAVPGRRRACPVTLVIRGPGPVASRCRATSPTGSTPTRTSRADRARRSPRLRRRSARCGVSSVSPATTATRRCRCVGLFSFIGADAGDRVAVGLRGTRRPRLRPHRPVARPERPRRRDGRRSAGEPLPFETSQPGLFAVGDVRSGSIKRVAAAVGEGSAAVRSVHDHLAFNH